MQEHSAATPHMSYLMNFSMWKSIHAFCTMILLSMDTGISEGSVASTLFLHPELLVALPSMPSIKAREELISLQTCACVLCMNIVGPKYLRVSALPTNALLNHSL